MDSERLQYLFQKQLEKTISVSEKIEMNEFLAGMENEESVGWLIEKLYRSNAEENQMSEEAANEMLRAILTTNQQTIKPIRFHRKKVWYSFAAAAIFILILAGGAWLAFFSKKKHVELTTLTQEHRFKNDISPANQGIILMLGNGKTISLDSLVNGVIATQGATRLVKNESILSYEGGHGSKAVYNTISTGKGRIFHLRLQDGTDVWLDALSSIRFPSAFVGTDRMVEVNGQAYFEVKKNERQPFKVKLAGQVIEVLGTYFNVNAHDTQRVQTSLLEGALKLSSDNGVRPTFLKPGQQTMPMEDGEWKTENIADVEEVIGWKNGRFQFNGSSIEDIMNQLARWYNIEVEYKDRIKETFVAKISKDMPVSKILGLLEMTGQVKFTIVEKRYLYLKVTTKLTAS